MAKEVKNNAVDKAVGGGTIDPDKLMTDTKTGQVKFNPEKKAKTKRNVLINFELCVSMRGYAKGIVLPLSCNKKSGLPVDRYWRRRLHDAQVDGCIKAIKKAPKKK